MNSLDAARYLVRAYPGGAESLAPRLGKRQSTLSHEVAGSDNYKLGLVDAEALTQFAVEQRVPNAWAILNAFAANCGALVVPLLGLYAGTGSTFEDLADMAKEFSEFVATTSAAMADGKITGNELRDVDRELSELIGCAQRVRNDMAAIHEAGQPVDAVPAAARMVPEAA